MNIRKYLQLAGLQDKDLLDQAEGILQIADATSDGLLWAKWKVRLFKAARISKLLTWGDNRLCIKHPELADWDIAPMKNVTANGDNVLWPGNVPDENSWMDPNPASYQYQSAIKANYWCEGEHPRSEKSRKAWYRRNAGEMVAYKRGIPVPVAAPDCWDQNGFKVRKLGNAWQLEGQILLLGFIPARMRIGYEITNVVRDNGTQLWYPIPGYDLRAPLTWSVIPFGK